MQQPPRRHATNNRDARRGAEVETDLRIIGGRFRGKKLEYEPIVQTGKRPAPDRSTLVTRPMKHRVREAIFNLVGPEVAGKHACDVFAGTGALGLEALSRGAAHATFIERHIPTANLVKRNIATLGVGESTGLLVTSAFLWSKRDLARFAEEHASPPWLVFLSPPYDFFVEREGDMRSLVDALVQRAPAGSILVVEADQRFDFERLPGGVKPDRHAGGWDVRTYSPAVVGLLRKSADAVA